MLRDTVVPTHLHTLIRAVATGDRSAFEQMYEEYQPRLVRYVLSRVSSMDEPEAESIVQDVMFRVYQKAGQYTGTNDAQAISWLYSIARNRTIDIARAMRRFQEVELEPDGPLYEQVAEILQDDDPRGREADDAIRQHMDSFVLLLTEREREVLSLKSSGMRANAIAQQLGITSPRVTQLLQSIQRKAKQYFETIDQPKGSH